MSGTGPLNNSAAAAAAAEAARRRAAEEARRRAEEEARKRAAEEAARKRAAEEAARKKAAEEAARKKAEEAQKAKMAEKAAERREAYSEQKADAKPELSPQMQKMMRIEAEFAASSKPMSRADDASLKLSSRIRAHEAAVERKIDGADKVPGEAKDAVRDLNKQVTDQARDVVKQADSQVSQINEMAKEATAGKTPAQKKAILEEADKQSAAIYQEAEKQVDKVLDQTYEKSGEILEKAEDDNGGGVKGWIKDRVDDVKDLVSDAWDAAKNVVGDATDAVGDAATAVGDYAADKAADFGKFIAEAAYDKVIDPALDKSALGEDNEYNNEKTGLLGDVITDRLEPGESVFLKLEADAEISGIQVGAGAQVQIKRVPMTDENGNPVTEPKDAKGRPPTELEVSLLADANVGVGFSASAGSGPVGKSGDERTLGAGAEASVSAQAGLSGQAEFKFRFDPNNQQDMNDMTGIFKTAAKTGLEAAIPGIGAALAASNVPDLAKDASAFASHLTEIRGEVGVYANASANASVSAGSLENKKPAGAEEAESPEQASMLKDLKNQGLDAAQMKAEIGASIGAEVKMGMSKDFRSGDTTLYFTVAGQAQANVAAAKFGEGIGGAASRTIAVTVDKSGEIEGVQIKDTQTKKLFKGFGSEDVQGQRIDDDALALLSGEDKITTTRTFKPGALEDFKQAFDDNKLAAVAGLAADAVRMDSNKLKVTNVTGTRTETVELGVDAKIAQLRATLGHAQDVDLTVGRG